MNIYNSYNSGYIPYNPYVPAGFPAMQYGPCLINQGPAQDVFQRSTVSNVNQAAVYGTGQCAPVAGVWDEKRLEAIYDKTYNIVMAQNPITREMNIQKPTLNFNSKWKDEDLLVLYMGGVNEVKIQDMSFFKGKLYLCKISDSSGETIDIKVLGQKDADDISKKYPEYIVTREELNDFEKELYISSMLAHELRHCIQAHLLSSTEGCAEEYKERFLGLKNALEGVIEVDKEIAALKGEPYIPGDEEKELEKLNYGLNYKPKKLLPENSLFKFSIMPSDNRYFSIKDHLLPAGKAGKEDPEAYYNNPLEIDAYNYAYEFFAGQMKNYPAGMLRNDVARNIGIALRLKVCDEEFPYKTIG